MEKRKSKCAKKIKIKIDNNSKEHWAKLKRNEKNDAKYRNEDFSLSYPLIIRY